jgi:hypothetical protein
VLDTLDSRVGRLLDCDSGRNVTGKRPAQLGSFVRDGEKRIARRMVVHLDEIDATSFEVSDRFPRVLSVGNAPPKRPVGWRIVEDPTRDSSSLGRLGRALSAAEGALRAD